MAHLVVAYNSIKLNKKGVSISGPIEKMDIIEYKDGEIRTIEIIELK